MAKESKEKELSDTQAYQHILDLFGADSVVHPEAISTPDIIRTGSPGLDRAIGVGGWPRGRMTQLAGKESSGKTLLCMLAIANWQAEHPENCAAFLDAEYTYDPSWAATLGVDNNRVFLVKSNDASHLFTGLVGKVKENPQTKKRTEVPGLFAMIASGQKITSKHPVTNKPITLNLGRMGLVILDSMAALQTPTEIVSDVGKQNMALMARFLSVELKKLTPGIADSNVAMIVINQVRVNPGQMFGNPECFDPFTTKLKVRMYDK
jgi:recombination protein RecA